MKKTKMFATECSMNGGTFAGGVNALDPYRNDYLASPSYLRKRAEDERQAALDRKRAEAGLF